MLESLEYSFRSCSFFSPMLFCFVSILFNCNLFIKFLIWWIQYEMDIYVCCQLIVGVKVIGWRHALTIRIITIYNMLSPFEWSKTSSIFCSFFVLRTLNHCKLYFCSFYFILRAFKNIYCAFELKNISMQVIFCWN